MEGAFSRIPHVTAPAACCSWTTSSRPARRPQPARQRSSMRVRPRSTWSRRAGPSPIGPPDRLKFARREGPEYTWQCSRPGLWLPGTNPGSRCQPRAKRPRKATVGRRAWSGLEVSPAPFDGRGVAGPAASRATGANTPAGECGVKDQVSRTGAPLRAGAHGLTFTGRGVPVSDDIRAGCAQAGPSRAPRAADHPDRPRARGGAPSGPDGLKDQGGAADPAEDVPRPRGGGRLRTALDDVAEKLERQLRDHHGRKLRRWHRGVRFPRVASPRTEPKRR